MPCVTVVGIAEDIKERELRRAPEAHYYLPAEQAAASAVGPVRAGARSRDGSQ